MRNQQTIRFITEMKQKEFEHIAHELRQRVLSISKGYGLNADESDDIAQDTLLKLWTLHSQIAEKKNANALATSIARHLCIDHFRQKTQVSLLDVRPIMDEQELNPHEQLESIDNAEWLEKRLNSLPPKEYQIIHLRQTDQKSNAEIATLLGIEQTSVATLLSRARKKLLQEIIKKNKYDDR